MPVANYPDLTDRVVLITGGATGIGAAQVRAFAANAARVVFLDLQADPGNALATELTNEGRFVQFIACDLLDLDALSAAITRVRREIGPVYALVNNAAVDRRQALGSIDADDFAWMMNANLRHVVFAAQQVLPQMREIGQGSIVNTSSVAWMRGIADLTLYSAAKAAIVGFTNALARDVGRDRIRVNAVAPGYVATPRQRALWHDDSAEQGALALQCLPDLIAPDDVAQATVFLCSDAARAITKQCLLVNAGSL